MASCPGNRRGSRPRGSCASLGRSQPRHEVCALAAAKGVVSAAVMLRRTSPMGQLRVETMIRDGVPVLALIGEHPLAAPAAPGPATISRVDLIHDLADILHETRMRYLVDGVWP